MWLSLPQLVYLRLQLYWNWNCLTSVLTELYYSSTPTQSPTQSLKSHVWSSSSGNNCHAVQRSLSFDTLYESIMGFFYLSQFPPTRFPLITTIRMCHFLPVHHSEWHFWPGRRSKYNNCLYRMQQNMITLHNLRQVYISLKLLKLSNNWYNVSVCK